jgi:hypothetical protein
MGMEKDGRDRRDFLGGEEDFRREAEISKC